MNKVVTIFIIISLVAIIFFITMIVIGSSPSPPSPSSTININNDTRAFFKDNILYITGTVENNGPYTFVNTNMTVIVKNDNNISIGLVKSPLNTIYPNQTAFYKIPITDNDVVGTLANISAYNLAVRGTPK